MFGFLRTLVYTLVIVVVGTCFFAWHYRVTTTRFLLSSVLNNPVAIGDIDISVSLSRINGKNVAIVNPPKSRSKEHNAIKTRVIEFKTSFLNLFKKELVIDEIYLDRVDFFVDMYNITGSKSNIKTIIGNIHGRTEERFPEGKKHKRPVIIKKIILQDVSFSYSNPLLTAGITTLEPITKIELLNIGSGHPVSAAQIASIITTSLLKRFTTLSGFKNMVESIPKIPIQWIKKIFVKEGDEEPIALEQFLDFRSIESNEQIGFLKKVFSFSKKPEEED